MISTITHHFDLFHLTSNTSLQLSFVNAIDTLARSTLSFHAILPAANLHGLLLDQLLCDNFLKGLSKKLHKMQVEAQNEEAQVDQN